jgi:phage regulator Rha-like protein
MAYQDSAEKILTVSAESAQTAERQRKSLSIGINVLKATDDSHASSLYGMTPEQLCQVLKEVADRGAEWPAVTGIALHDAQSIARLEESP